jgi:Protein of unknown function (DUF4199)
MKKTVLTFGLIGGAILAAMMFATLPFMDKIGFDRGEIIGYTTMILAFLLVFFGIRSYRENVGGGQITFGLRSGYSNHAGRVCLLCRCLGDHLLQIHAGLC